MPYQYTNRKLLTAILLAMVILFSQAPISFAQEKPTTNPFQAAWDAVKKTAEPLLAPFRGVQKGAEKATEKVVEETQKKIQEIEKAEPPSYIKECPSGETRVDNICYKDGSAELNTAVERAKNIRNASSAGSCDPGFHYIITNKISNLGECYKLNSPEYKEALEKAKQSGKIKQDIQEYKTQVPIPCDPSFGLGSCPSLQTPAGYVARIYQFGLMIVGLFAFGGIVYGALKYILSAGNVGSQQDAKDQITQAVLGLVLLLGAFIILYTINPRLTSLRNPEAPILDLSVLAPPEEETGQGQNLVGSGGGGDPLCSAALDVGLNLNIFGQARTGEEVGELGQKISGKIGEILGASGEKRTGPQCLKCVANASGASGLFSQCVCDPGYEQVGGECSTKCPFGTERGADNLCKNINVRVQGSGSSGQLLQ